MAIRKCFLIVSPTRKSASSRFRLPLGGVGGAADVWERFEVGGSHPGSLISHSAPCLPPEDCANEKKKFKC